MPNREPTPPSQDDELDLWREHEVACLLPAERRAYDQLLREAIPHLRTMLKARERRLIRQALERLEEQHYDKPWHFSPNDYKQGFNEANAKWRQAIDQEKAKLRGEE